MKIQFVYGFLPCLIIKSNIIPKHSEAICLGLIILINSQLAAAWHDQVITHHLVHSRQCWRSLGLFLPLYFFHPTSRMKYECEAVAAELKHTNSQLSYQKALLKLLDLKFPFAPALVKRCFDSYLK